MGRERGYNEEEKRLKNKNLRHVLPSAKIKQNKDGARTQTLPLPRFMRAGSIAWPKWN